ncbi:hypothetical protein [Streptomyces sp. STR69]|uniref:hypothetical protein n=1 Tax=Streptomyces sp. STR69 TaxID=1796942 RepID=UPI0021C8D179|nr:hypothetical protein [Streptomyces sp. STR69]
MLDRQLAHGVREFGTEAEQREPRVGVHLEEPDRATRSVEAGRVGRAVARAQDGSVARSAALPDPDADDSTPLTRRLAATHLIVVQQELGMENWRTMAAGRTADEAYDDAVAEAERAYGQLMTGLDAVFPAGAEGP